MCCCHLPFSHLPKVVTLFLQQWSLWLSLCCRKCAFLFFPLNISPPPKKTNSSDCQIFLSVVGLQFLTVLVFPSIPAMKRVNLSQGTTETTVTQLLERFSPNVTGSCCFWVRVLLLMCGVKLFFYFWSRIFPCSLISPAQHIINLLKLTQLPKKQEGWWSPSNSYDRSAVPSILALSLASTKHSVSGIRNAAPISRARCEAQNWWDDLLIRVLQGGLANKNSMLACPHAESAFALTIGFRKVERWFGLACNGPLHCGMPLRLLTRLLALKQPQAEFWILWSFNAEFRARCWLDKKWLLIYKYGVAASLFLIVLFANFKQFFLLLYFFCLGSEIQGPTKGDLCPTVSALNHHNSSNAGTRSSTNSRYGNS